MKSRTAFVVFLAVVATAATSWAQYRQPPPRKQKSWSAQQPQHRLEILGYGGYLWSGGIDAYYGTTYGTMDIKDSAIWGIEADVNVRPGAQMVLLYHRQDSELTFEKAGGVSEVAGDIAVEHWHIGGMSGVQKGNVMPFGMFTIGGTRFVPEFGGASDDIWKFSILFGLGAKIYISERVGLRVQGRMPWIFLSGGAAMGCGTGGCYTSFGGSGIVQGDVSGGLFVMF
jgi:hypothetical protein